MQAGNSNALAGQALNVEVLSSLVTGSALLTGLKPSVTTDQARLHMRSTFASRTRQSCVCSASQACLTMCQMVSINAGSLLFFYRQHRQW